MNGKLTPFGYQSDVPIYYELPIFSTALVTYGHAKADAITQHKPSKVDWLASVNVKLPEIDDSPPSGFP
jgi:hypothetical protein